MTGETKKPDSEVVKTTGALATTPAVEAKVKDTAGSASSGVAALLTTSHEFKEAEHLPPMSNEQRKQICDHHDQEQVRIYNSLITKPSFIDYDALTYSDLQEAIYLWNKSEEEKRTYAGTDGRKRDYATLVLTHFDHSYGNWRPLPYPYTYNPERETIQDLNISTAGNPNSDVDLDIIIQGAREGGLRQERERSGFFCTFTGSNKEMKLAISDPRIVETFDRFAVEIHNAAIRGDQVRMMQELKKLHEYKVQLKEERKAHKTRLDEINSITDRSTRNKQMKRRLSDPIE